MSFRTLWGCVALGGFAVEAQAAAEVCPVREYPLIPFGTLGDTMEMIKVEDEWYFTGKIAVW